MFVLQLRVNKREISVHIGQQRGSTEGDLFDPYVFTGSFKASQLRVEELLTFGAI